jgi:PLP dependent protein
VLSPRSFSPQSGCTTPPRTAGLMPLTAHQAIADNLAAIRSRIADAARRSGREAESVTLVAVSKTFGADAVRAAWEAGQRDFGENKVQEGEEKIADTPDLDGIRWHLIGHLQSNKAKRAAAAFAVIQAIDSIDLLRRVDDAAAAQGTRPDVLIQADLAGEATKFGAAEAEVEAIARAADGCRAVRLAGLMILPPWSEHQEETRPWFVRLRTLRERLVSAGVQAHALRHLSMGMSHDFEAAVEEGATLVRVGTAIFGKRVKP